MTAQTIKFRLELPDDYMVAIHLGRAGGPLGKTELKPSQFVLVRVRWWHRRSASVVSGLNDDDGEHALPTPLLSTFRRRCTDGLMAAQVGIQPSPPKGPKAGNPDSRLRESWALHATTTWIDKVTAS